MSIFYYQHRQKGYCRSEALKQAQLELRQFKKENLTEISNQMAIRRKEAKTMRAKYLIDSAEYLEYDCQYQKYARIAIEIEKRKKSFQEFPFSHPRYWAAFICQGLR